VEATEGVGDEIDTCNPALGEEDAYQRDRRDEIDSSKGNLIVKASAFAICEMAWGNVCAPCRGLDERLEGPCAASPRLSQRL
jgi:hypothetical protein